MLALALATVSFAPFSRLRDVESNAGLQRLPLIYLTRVLEQLYVTLETDSELILQPRCHPDRDIQGTSETRKLTTSSLLRATQVCLGIAICMELEQCRIRGNPSVALSEMHNGVHC